MKAHLIDRSGNFVASIDKKPDNVGVLIMADSRISLRYRVFAWNGHQYQETSHLFMDGEFKIVS